MEKRIESGNLPQRIIGLLLENNGIRLDICVNDEEGAVYNCEMQRRKRREVPKRSRHYHGSIDLDLTAAGEPYENMKNWMPANIISRVWNLMNIELGS